MNCFAIQCLPPPHHHHCPTPTTNPHTVLTHTSRKKKRERKNPLPPVTKRKEQEMDRGSYPHLFQITRSRSERGREEGKFSSDMRTFIFPNIACLGRSGRNSTRRQRVVFFYCSLREIKVRIKKGEYTQYKKKRR